MASIGGCHRSFYPLNCSAAAANDLRHFENAVTDTKLLTDGILDLPPNLRTTEFPALLADPIQSGHDSRSDHRPFQFSEHRGYLHHCPPERTGAINALLIADQSDSGGVEFRHRLCDMEYAAPETIHGPDQKNVEPAAHGVLEHLIERWTLLPPFAAADPLILVLLNDLEPTALRQLGQNDSLVLRGLAVTADPKVDCRP